MLAFGGGKFPSLSAWNAQPRIKGSLQRNLFSPGSLPNDLATVKLKNQEHGIGCIKLLLRLPLRLPDIFPTTSLDTICTRLQARPLSVEGVEDPTCSSRVEAREMSDLMRRQ
jgi:hypothetical protein